jgi:signal transduction histidine kinase
LVQSLRELAKLSEEMYELPCEFESPQSIELPDEDKRTHLYRIAQEAIQNAAKHADATAIVLKLEENKNQIRLTVRDDGAGFDPSLRTKTGSGLRIMNYRAELIGGSLEIQSSPGEGTMVDCRVPV